MNIDDRFKALKAEYARESVPQGFADEVMQRIETAQVEPLNRSRMGWGKTLIRWSLVSLAMLVAYLRIVQVIWVLVGPSTRNI